MKNLDRIVVDPSVMNGQPCIKGTRLTVKRVLLALAQQGNDGVGQDYPQLTDEDLRQALAYAAANLDDETLELRSAS